MLVRNQKFFMAGRGFAELGHFNKNFVNNKKKRVLQANILMFFLLDVFKTIFWMENLTQRLTQSRLVFPKSGHFFSILKKDRGGLPSPLYLRGSWGYVNMHRYPWICLNIIANAWINHSEYGRALNMPDHLTCSTGFWSSN